jgi:hypothetical protein
VENGGVGATVENGGVSATRIDVADRWTGTLRGPDHQRLGEVVGAALTGGVSSTVRPIQFSNRIKFISKGFKFAPNFDWHKKVPSLAPKISNKIWIERASNKEQLSL